MKVSYMFIAIAMICFTLLYIVNGEKVEEIRPRGGKGRRGRRVFKGKKSKLPSTESDICESVHDK